MPDADHILIIDDGTVKDQGSFAELSHRPGAVKELMALTGTSLNTNDTSQVRGSAVTIQDDMQSSYIGSITESNEDIEAEMTSTQAKRNSVLVYLFASGRFLMCCALTLMVIQSAMPSIIPVYIQAWTSALQVDRGKLFTYMGG